MLQLPRLFLGHRSVRGARGALPTPTLTRCLRKKAFLVAEVDTLPPVVQRAQPPTVPRASKAQDNIAGMCRVQTEHTR